MSSTAVTTEETSRGFTSFEVVDYKLDDYQMVAAVDFGSYGFAAAYCEPGTPATTTKVVSQWPGASYSKSDTKKTLAALLLDRRPPHDCIAFGDEAREHWLKLAEDGTDEARTRGSVLYFEHFKRLLYSGELYKDVLVQSVAAGEHMAADSLPLCVLIRQSLTHLVEVVLSELNVARTREGLKRLGMTDVFWVLTVPAIWDEMAMECMRQCAKEAGMLRFAMAKEPIAATFAMLESADATRMAARRRAEDRKLLVVDCGGGTIDATCIEVLRADAGGDEAVADGFVLREVHYNSGLFTGGIEVDDGFDRLCDDLFGAEPMAQIRRENPESWQKQIGEFRDVRFQQKASRTEDAFGVSIKCGELQRYLKANKKAVRRLVKAVNRRLSEESPSVYFLDERDSDEYKAEMKSLADRSADDDSKSSAETSGRKKRKRCFFDLKQSKYGAQLHISHDGWRWLHYAVCAEVSSFVGRLVAETGIKRVILVGGFSKSEFLRKHVQMALESTVKLETTAEAHLSVVTGALHWVCKERRLRRHMAALTYGVAIDREYDPGAGDPIEKRGADGMVHGAFCKLIERNVQYDEGTVRKFTFGVAKDTRKVQCDIFATAQSPAPQFIDDSCHKVKSFALELAVAHSDTRVSLELQYFDTGIKLMFVDTAAGGRRKEVQIAHPSESHVSAIG